LPAAPYVNAADHDGLARPAYSTLTSRNFREPLPFYADERSSPGRSPRSS
jgi:hypothetical protein